MELALSEMRSSTISTLPPAKESRLMKVGNWRMRKISRAEVRPG